MQAAIDDDRRGRRRRRSLQEPPSNSNDAASKSRSKRARVTTTSTTLTLAQLLSPDIEELKPSRATPWLLNDDDVATYVLDARRLRSYATTGDDNCGYYGLCQWMNELGCFQPPCGGGVWTVRRLRVTLAALIYEFRDYVVRSDVASL